MASKNIGLLVGKWMPSQRDAIIKWLGKEIQKYDKENPLKHKALQKYYPDGGSEEEILKEFHRNVVHIDEIAKVLELTPPMKDLFKAMGTEAEVGMMMIEMFSQQPNYHPYYPAVRYLLAINTWCRKAPEFIDESGTIIPVPIGCILTYAMATPAGFAAFVNARINTLFQAILKDYGTYLQTSASANVLADIPGGWFTEQALEEMKDFADTFVCNPKKPHYGFGSFDDFFTRKLKKTARPIASPENDNVIVNACENAPYQVAHHVGQHEPFWVKSQPYSLQYILDNDKSLERFVGGTIYQGFLSPHTYHRFHAPVSGKIVRKDVLPGTYYSQPYFIDGSANYISSQPYLAHVAARGIVIIEADNKALGLVAFIPIGMVEVSYVDLKDLDGVDYVKKGDGIGTFHFGGSSHLLIFEKGVTLAFDLQGIKPDPFGNKFLNVRSRLASVVLL